MGHVNGVRRGEQDVRAIGEREALAVRTAEEEAEAAAAAAARWRGAWRCALPQRAGRPWRRQTRAEGEGREALESAPEPGTDVAPSLHAAVLRFDDPEDEEKKPVEGGGDADG